MKHQQVASVLLLVVLVALLVSVRFRIEQPRHVPSGFPARHAIDPGLMMDVGSALVAKREYLEAVVVFEMLVANFPDSSEAEEALCQVGLCWFSLDDDDQMAETWERFLRKYPRSRYASSIRKSYRMLKRDRRIDSLV